MNTAGDSASPSTFVEVALGAYLLTLPFGPEVPAWVREILLLAILVGLVAARVMQNATRSTAPSYGLLPFFVLVALSHLLSILMSSNPSLSLSASVYAPFGALIFLAAQQAITSPEAWRRLAIIFLVIVSVLSLDGTYQLFTGGSLLTDQSTFAGRVRGSIPHPNDVALIPLLTPFILTAVARSRDRAVVVVAALCLPLATITLIGSRSRNAWLGIAAACIVWSLVAGRRRIGLIVLISLALCLGLALALDLAAIRERLLNVQIGGRLGVWIVALEMFKEAPIFGQGVHVFDDFYPAYLDRVSLPEGYVPEVAYVPWAHNIYLELLAERGLVGFICFGALIGAMTRALVGAARRPANQEHRLFTAALAGSLACFLVMGMLDLTFLKDWVVLIFWFLAALCARISDSFRISGDPATQC